MATMEETSFDPRRRRLCPDGACVGLIGDNGRCKVCGLPAGGVPATDSGDAAPFAADVVDADADAADADADAAGAEVDGDSGVEVAPGSAAGGFDPKRRLCDDGACVGVVGPNGVCNVCGRPAAVKAAEG